MTRRRRSNVTRLPAEQRAFIERLLREDRLTLSEMIAAINKQFPGAEVSRSGLHRYQAGFAELAGRMREIEAASAALVGELGEGVGEKSGALLAQAVTTLAANAALRAQANDETSIEDVRKLARAAKDAMGVRSLSLDERRTIAREAREQLQREQAERLDSTARAQGMDEDQVRFWREKVLGIQ